MTPVLMLRSDVTMSGRWKASIIWLSDNCSAIHFHRRDSRHLDQPARLLTQRWLFFLTYTTKSRYPHCVWYHHSDFPGSADPLNHLQTLEVASAFAILLL